jgi:hypothetical protein
MRGLGNCLIGMGKGFLYLLVDNKIENKVLTTKMKGR